MSTQPTLFDRPVHAPKQVRETSKEAYSDLLPTIADSQLAVLQALSSYLSVHPDEPTGKELMRYMGIEDPNSVRPRLTELSEMRYVEASEKSIKCPVSNRPAHTWRITQRGRLFLRGQR